MSSIRTSIKAKLLGALAAVTFISAAAASASTVAHYRFEDGSAGAAATQATDSSPSGYHLNAITDGDNSPLFSSDVPVSTVPGTGDANALSVDIAGSAIGFQGVDGEGLSNVVFDDITIELWINFSDPGGWQTFIGRDDRNNQTGGDTPMLQFQNTDGGQFRVFWYDRAAVGHDLEAFTPAADTWYHVAAVGDSAAGTMSLYVDGVQVATRGDFTGLYVPDPASHWTFGRGQWGGNNVDWVNAQIDEVRFSDAALSTSEFLNFEGARIEVSQQPSDVIIWSGESATFSVDALLVGDGELSYQWEISEDGGASWDDIGGATSATYTIASAGTDLDRNQYRVSISFEEVSEISDEVVLRVGEVDAPEPQNVVAHYRFDEGSVGGSATGAVDSSGNGYDLGVRTENGTSPVYSSEVPGSRLPQTGEANAISLDVDGAEVAVEGVDSEGLSNVDFDNFTIEAFVNFEAIGGWQTFIGRDDRNNQTNDAHAIFYLQNRGDGNQFGVSWVDRNGNINAPGLQGVSIQANTWYHVAVVADLDAGSIALYVNGVEVDRNNSFAGLFVPTAPSTQWNIGRGQWEGNPGDWVNGKIDEVRFSNVALPPTEFLGFGNSVLNIAFHPQDAEALVGDEVTFSALAGGGGLDPLNYQWEVSQDGGASWSDITGATESTYTISSASLAEDGNLYRVVASRGGDSETSGSAALSVPDYPDPVIVQDLAMNPLLFVGEPYTLSVEATGQGQISYQWQREGVDMPGETGTSITFDPLTVADSGTYSVIITDDGATQDGMDAKSVTLTTFLTAVSHSQGAISLNMVGAATDTGWHVDIGLIDRNDEAGVIPVANWNNSATVTGVANQTTPLPLVNDVGQQTSATAVWTAGNTWGSRVGSGPLMDKDGNERIYHGYIESRDGSSVTIENIPFGTYDVYVYPLGVEGPSGEYIRSVTLEDAVASTSTLYGRNYSGDPANHPIPFILAVASTLEEAEDLGPASVFRFDNVSGSSFTVTHNDEVGWNLGGIAGISIVNTTPGDPVRPLLTSRPAARFAPAGGEIQLSVTAQAMNEGGTLSYQWQKDGANISGATGSTLVLSDTSSADSGMYSVVVTENSTLGNITNEATVPVVVVDDDRRALLSVDLNVGTHPSMQGHGRLRSTGLEPFVYPPSENDNPMEIGLGDTVWNRVWGRTGANTYGDFVDAGGMLLSGVTFSLEGVNGVGDEPSGGGIEPLGEEVAETYSAPLLRDYVHAGTEDSMTLTLGGLQAFAGRDVTLVVYALGPLSTFDIGHESDDIATVSLAEANNPLGLAPIATETADEGREVRWNENALAAFEARVDASGTVSWTVGPVPDRPGINAMNGFQVLFSDQGEPIDPPESGIANWRETYFGTTENTGDAANDADFDGDGLQNLMEYALGSDPTIPGDGADAVRLGRDGNFLTLTFDHSDDASVTYVIEATDDLSSGEWVEQASYTFTSSGTETYVDSVTVGTGSQRFLKLSVTIDE